MRLSMIDALAYRDGRSLFAFLRASDAEYPGSIWVGPIWWDVEEDGDE